LSFTSNMHMNHKHETPLKEDIIHAHDIFTMFIRSMHEYGTASDEFVTAIYACRDTLCWILGHSGTAFETNLGAAFDILMQENKTNLN